MLKRVQGVKAQGVYQTPSIDLFEVKPEKGFAESFSKEEEEF